MLGNVKEFTNSTTVITSGPNMVSNIGSSNMASNNEKGSDRNSDVLFKLSAIEVRDDFEERMHRNYLYVQGIFGNKSEQQAHEELNRLANSSQSSNDEVTLGIIVSILLDATNAPRYFHEANLISRDALNLFTTHLQNIISDKYFRLHDHIRKQLLWLLKELLRTRVQNVENLYYCMFRNIISGDLTPSNIALTEALLDILIELRYICDTNVVLLSFALFNYLRLIVDHHNPNFQSLRAKEIQYCICLMKERFIDFIWIGRDLIRLLQQVAAIPEFDQFWKILLTNPGSISPNFGGIMQILKIRTPRRFIKLRLTFELEKKLIFLTTQIRFGQHRRYQEWLHRQYFANSESQMLRCDVIRFICCSIHPTNEIIGSDIFPRWALIGWILSVCNQHILSIYARMALFYDWLFYDANDSANSQIMDIEPGILVMYYSLKNYPGITGALMDFLSRICKEFHPTLQTHIKKGINAALGKICEMRVLSAPLQTLFDNPRLDYDVRAMFYQNFPSFCSDPSAPPVQPQIQAANFGMPGQPLDQLGPVPPGHMMGVKFGALGQPLPPGSQPSVIQINNFMPDGITTANFSDDEDDDVKEIPNPSPAGPAKKKLKKSNNNFPNGANSRATKSDDSTFSNNSANVGPSSNNKSGDLLGSIINNSTNNNSGDNNGPNDNNGNGNMPLMNNSMMGNNMDGLIISHELPNNHLNNNNYFNVMDSYSSLVSGNAAMSKEELLEQIENLEDAQMRNCLNRLCKEKSKQIRCQEMEKFTKLVLNDDIDESEHDYYTNLTMILLPILEDDLCVRIFPSDFLKPSKIPEEKELKESISGPLFVMFRALAECSEEDQSNRNALLILLAAMGANNTKIGYLLLYFLIVANFKESRMSIYRSYVSEMSKELGDSIVQDLKCCAYDDVYMFFFILPEVFTHLNNFLLGCHVQLAKLIVSHADSVQLQTILGRVVSGSIKLLRKDAVLPILTASLEWDSLEQYHLWQILLAHNVSVDSIIPILSKLEYNVHSEALSNLMLFLQRETPTNNLIKHLFNRESKSGDNFTVSILIYWAQNHTEKLAELIGNFILSKTNSPNKRNKRALNNVAKSQVNIPSNIEQILYYLDEMKKLSKNSNFFTFDATFALLDQLRQFCSSAQKSKYQELFADLSDDDTSKSSSNSISSGSNSNKKSSTNATKKNQTVLSKTRSGNTTNKNIESDTESESSDDDIPLTKSKTNARKKRKQPIGSDSD